LAELAAGRVSSMIRLAHKADQTITAEIRRSFIVGPPYPHGEMPKAHSGWNRELG